MGEWSGGVLDWWIGRKRTQRLKAKIMLEDFPVSECSALIALFRGQGYLVNQGNRNPRQ
jgi:hypothetical protein